PRNVRLSLWTDGRAPHGQYGRTYSCRPIILTAIQSPLGMCMSAEVIMVILDPSNPKRFINVYLEPLIEDLQNLRHVGVLTQFFPLDHPNRRNKKAFNKNRVERNVTQPRLMGEQIRKWVGEFSPAVEVSLSLADGNNEGYSEYIEGPEDHNVTDRSLSWTKGGMNVMPKSRIHPDSRWTDIAFHEVERIPPSTSRSGNSKSYDESDDDSFDEYYETEEDKNSN
ncbi:UNVERIFIED_CONTAM: hypothetical protein Sindi_1855600, partial [Sesamum indicum]